MDIKLGMSLVPCSREQDDELGFSHAQCRAISTSPSQLLAWSANLWNSQPWSKWARYARSRSRSNDIVSDGTLLISHLVQWRSIVAGNEIFARSGIIGNSSISNITTTQRFCQLSHRTKTISPNPCDKFKIRQSMRLRMRGTAGKSKIQLHRATFTKPKITYKALEWQPAGLKSTIERIRRRIVLYGHQQLTS